MYFWLNHIEDTILVLKVKKIVFLTRHPFWKVTCIFMDRRLSCKFSQIFSVGLDKVYVYESQIGILNVVFFVGNLKPIRIQPSVDANRNYEAVTLHASGFGATWTSGTYSRLYWVVESRWLQPEPASSTRAVINSHKRLTKYDSTFIIYIDRKSCRIPQATAYWQETLSHTRVNQ